jgi:hypothetical protein
MQSWWHDVLVYIMQMAGYALATLGGIALSQFKQWLHARKRKFNSLSHTLDQSLSIRECLVELRTQVDCDLTLLLQIKNGVYYSSGESEQKITVTHVSPSYGHGVDPLLIQSLSDIPISIVGPSIRAIIRADLYLPNVADMQPDDFYLSQIFTGVGASCVHLIPVFNKANHLVGVAGLVWFGKTHALIQDEVHHTEIKNAQQRLGLLLFRK